MNTLLLKNEGMGTGQSNQQMPVTDNPVFDALSCPFSMDFGPGAVIRDPGAASWKAGAGSPRKPPGCSLLPCSSRTLHSTQTGIVLGG